jgi:hypothetical protein
MIILCHLKLFFHCCQIILILFDYNLVDFYWSHFAFSPMFSCSIVLDIELFSVANKKYYTLSILLHRMSRLSCIIKCWCVLFHNSPLQSVGYRLRI